MSSPMDGTFTGKSCAQVDSSNETSTPMGFTRPSFDGFTAPYEQGSPASGPAPNYPGSSVQEGDMGHQSWNEYQTFDPDQSRTLGYGNSEGNGTTMDGRRSFNMNISKG